MVHRNLADLSVRERIISGSDGRDLAIADYRRKVEETIQSLLAANPVCTTAAGDEISDRDLHEPLSCSATGSESMKSGSERRTMFAPPPSSSCSVTSSGGPTGALVNAVSRRSRNSSAPHHLLGLADPLPPGAPDYVLDRRQVERADLVAAPFTRIHPDGIRGVFGGGELEDVLALTRSLVA